MDESSMPDIEHVVGEGLEDDITANWESLLASAESLGDAYREAGYDTVVCQPTDVSVIPVDSPQFGLTAVVEDDQYDRLRTFGSLAPAAVTRAESDDIVLILATAEGNGTAAVIPLYYQRTESEEGTLRENDGTIPVRVRSLTATTPVSISFETPAHFLPDERFDAN